MQASFFDLRATHNPHRWHLPLTPELCVGPPGQMFMFGGVGLASAIAAMEGTTGRPLIWATAQYLSYARPPSVVDLDVWMESVRGFIPNVATATVSLLSKENVLP